MLKAICHLIGYMLVFVNFSGMICCSFSKEMRESYKAILQREGISRDYDKLHTALELIAGALLIMV